MSERYNLVLTGKILAGRDRNETAAALAKLMRVPEDRALALLSGLEQVVKRDLDQAMLARYVAALEAAGVETRSVVLTAAAGASTQPSPVASVMPAPAAVVAEQSLPLPAAPPVEMVTCPICKTEQPKRALCKSCAADLPRALAAAEEARRTPSAPSPAADRATPRAAPPAERPKILTFYKKSLLIEILVFVILTSWWAYCVMIDPDRNKILRGIGVVVFILWVVGVMGVFKEDPEQEAVYDAIAYASHASNKVGDYAIAHQEMPDRTDAVTLTKTRPRTVELVDIRKGGEVRVALGGTLKKIAGGVIIMKPSVRDGTISWSCNGENIPIRYIKEHCND